MKKEEHILLDKIGKDLPFTIPENYFENFTVQIESQVSKKAIPIRSNTTWRLRLYVAAIFIGLLLIGGTLYNVYQNKIDNTEKIEQYILSQIDDATLLDFYLEELEYNE